MCLDRRVFLTTEVYPSKTERLGTLVGKESVLSPVTICRDWGSHHG